MLPADYARCPGERVGDGWMSDCKHCARRTHALARVSGRLPRVAVVPAAGSACASNVQAVE
jgi:hypothetical protein